MTNPAGTRMFAEAAEAGEVVARQWAANKDIVERLAAVLRAAPPSTVVTCARGSSDHAATYAKYLIETRAHRLVVSAAPSVASVYHGIATGGDLLAIGISQSGRSPDILSAMEAAVAAGARTVAMVNDESSPLADMAQVTLPLTAGPERSVAATKSYIAALAAIARLVASWTEDRALSAALDILPAQLAAAWQADWSPLSDALADAQGLYVVGRGVGLGIAQEMALKLKETCGLHAEAFSAAEVRHGPMAIVGPGFPVIVLRQDDETTDGIDALAAEFRARGAPVLVTGEQLPLAKAHAVVQPILAVQSFYRAANTLSLRRGLDPDRPPHLSKVTETL